MFVVIAPSLNKQNNLTPSHKKKPTTKFTQIHFQVGEWGPSESFHHAAGSARENWELHDEVLKPRAGARMDVTAVNILGKL